MGPDLSPFIPGKNSQSRPCPSSRADRGFRVLDRGKPREFRGVFIIYISPPPPSLSLNPPPGGGWGRGGSGEENRREF